MKTLALNHLSGCSLKRFFLALIIVGTLAFFIVNFKINSCKINNVIKQEIKEGLHEDDGFIDAKALILTPTKTDPPFIFANLGKGVVSATINDHGSFAPIETVIFKYILKEKCKTKPVPIVVDIGGNMGYFTTYAGKMGCYVKTYEPVPNPLRFIKINTLLNKLNPLVEIHHNAVGEKRGYLNMTENSDWGLSIVRPDGKMRVESIILEDIIKENLILMKIDVEGHEGSVMHGLEEILEKYEIDNMIIETSAKTDFMRAFINSILTKDSYVIVNYVEEYFTPNHNKNLSQIQCRIVNKLSDGQWITWQDLWYIKKGSATYENLFKQLKCT
jgi:FkbM family methyltransferase